MKILITGFNGQLGRALVKGKPKSISLLLARLIELELKCKLNHTVEKTLLSQFILSTSVLARKRINF